MMIIVFLDNNPLLLLGILIWTVLNFAIYKKIHSIKKGIIYFVPLAVITLIINMIFAEGGRIVLFEALGKNFTLETLVYALIMSFKILIVIYLFMSLEFMMDTDSAVSYFSYKLPKSTLTLLVGIKLVPNMKTRIKELKEVYTIRGLNYEEKSIKGRIKSSIPLLSILLEDSLEGSFDIAESAYVRGFLSGKRSIYEKQDLKKRDFSLILMSCSLILTYLVFYFKGSLDFNPYNYRGSSDLISKAAFMVLGIIIIEILYVLGEFTVSKVKRKELEHELY